MKIELIGFLCEHCRRFMEHWGNYDVLCPYCKKITSVKEKIIIPLKIEVEI